MTEPDQKKDETNQIGLHVVRNFVGHPSQLSLFDDQHEKFAEIYGVKVDPTIEEFGVELNDIQMRVMEGILKGFSETHYLGNISPEDKNEIASEKYSGKLPETYKYVKEIPRLRVTQKQIIEWAGLNLRSIGDKEHALEALYHLGTKQFCFYYDRLALGPDGEPEKDRNGNWKKESVQAVDTLFTVRVVRDKAERSRGKGNDKGNFVEKQEQGNIKYYEITPSPIFLDQRETYFMLIPFKWRNEVQALYNKKRVSAYVYRFLFYLRYQYETKRRSKYVNPPYQMRLTLEEIAIAIKMPKSVYNRQKERAKSIVEDALSVAEKLGYLTKYEKNAGVYVLNFRDEKYLLARTSVEKVLKEIAAPSSTANYLFELYYKTKKELNPHQEVPTGREREEHLNEFTQLLNKVKNPEDIAELIKWGLLENYWCNRLSTPNKLRLHFNEALTALNAQRRQSKKGSSPLENRKIAESLGKIMSQQRQDLIFEVLNKTIEIGKKGYNHVDCIEYSSKHFSSELEHALKKHGISQEVYQQVLV